MRARTRMLMLAGLVSIVTACSDDGPMAPEPLDPATAPRVSVDRFSSAAAALFERTPTNGMPAAATPINFDRVPFVTQGFGPDGRVLRYYNFDVMSNTPAPIYVLFREGSTQPVAGQLNIIDAVPGDPGYNDFWQVVRVTVPASYVANTATSFADIENAGFSMVTTTTLVNCPVVPAGSTASEGGGAAGLTQGWYRDQAVFYFNFGEAPLTATAAGLIPTSPIFVTFNINPNQAGGGPPSGFVTEAGGVQTHNVLATVPGSVGYSPLWEVIPFTNTAFASVRNLATAQAAMNFGTAALVNCPVVAGPF